MSSRINTTFFDIIKCERMIKEISQFGVPDASCKQFKNLEIFSNKQSENMISAVLIETSFFLVMSKKWKIYFQPNMFSPRRLRKN